MRLQFVRPIGAFEYRWPAALEKFNRGWECEVLVNGRPLQARHGLGRRLVYGRERVHSVTWLEGAPSVEGVEADDYADSLALLSLLRRSDKKSVRTDEDMPPGYDDFLIVNHDDELKAAYSRTGFAVKIVEDDVASWAAHAVIRAATFNRLPWNRKARKELPARRPTTPPAPPIVTVARAEPTAVVDALVAYADQLESAPDRVPSFTPHLDANSLILEDPFAFLVAVIFDQGIPAERAWQAPYELKRRLGHLDPARIAREVDKVGAAVGKSPKLHRFIGKIPEWIVSAAKRVVNDYGGVAGAIWAGTPTARVLQDRLLIFDGIGQKKAAMAVEILERDLKVPITALEGSDVAYDVHVRRVFLRTGLAQRDDLDHIVAVARDLFPQRPGKLDFVTWRIGRTWCHAGTPECGGCILTQVCPKEVFRAVGVKGV